MSDDRQLTRVSVSLPRLFGNTSALAHFTFGADIHIDPRLQMVQAAVPLRVYDPAVGAAAALPHGVHF